MPQKLAHANPPQTHQASAKATQGDMQERHTPESVRNTQRRVNNLKFSSTSFCKGGESREGGRGNMVSGTRLGYGQSLASGADLHSHVDPNPRSPSGRGGPAAGEAAAREAEMCWAHVFNAGSLGLSGQPSLSLARLCPSEHKTASPLDTEKPDWILLLNV